MNGECLAGDKDVAGNAGPDVPIEDVTGLALVGADVVDVGY